MCLSHETSTFRATAGVARGYQFSRLESSFLKDREPQSQVSIRVMTVTTLYLAQPLFFSFGEVRKCRVGKWFAPGRLVRKICGSKIFICLSPPFPVTVHCFWDQTNASSAAQAVFPILDGKPDTPAKWRPWTWTLLASTLSHKQIHVPKHSPPSPASYLQLSVGCLHLWTSPQGWGSCRYLWFHQASRHSSH